MNWERSVVTWVKTNILDRIPIPGLWAGSSSAVVLDRLGSVILHYNNMQSYWWLFVQTRTVAAKGVVIHKIDAAQAALVAGTIEAQPATSPVPQTVAVALMASESLLDPLCENGNFLGSNPTKELGGFDMGLCQLKLKYIVSADVANVDAAKAFAFDPTKAVPYLYATFAAKIEWAKGTIAANRSALAKWNDPLILAVGAYKLGETGVMKLYQAGTWAAELNNFIQLELWFASQLGVPSALA